MNFWLFNLGCVCSTTNLDNSPLRGYSFKPRNTMFENQTLMFLLQVGKRGKKRQEATINETIEKPVRKPPTQNIVINQNKLFSFSS